MTRMYAAAVVDANTGFVFGNGSEILKTADGGTSWTHQVVDSSPGQTVLSACFTSGGVTGYAVGSSGMLLKTTDGGQVWRPRAPGVSNSFNGVCFLDADHGFVACSGGLVLATTNGGATWMLEPTGQSVTLRSITFPASVSLGYAVGDNGTILKTTDGGEHWNMQTSGTTSTLYSVAFRDEQTGYAVGSSGRTLRTTDGGAHWYAQYAGSSSLYSATATGPTSAVAVGGYGAIWRTTNSGVSWQSVTSGTSDDLYDIEFATDGQNGLAVGCPYWDNGCSILRTADGGATWSRVNRNVTGENLWSCHFCDANSGVVAGDNGTVLRTTDGGQNWTPLLTGIGNDLYAAFCHSSTEIHVAGSGGMILRTTNAGSTWEIQTTGVSVNLLGMDFPVDGSTGYVVGTGGVVLKTTNSGQVWVRESTGTTKSLCAVCFPQDNSTGYAAGGWYEGIILRTTNGGQAWDSVCGTWEDLWGISFGTASIGFAVGEYGTVVKTTDAGNSWIENSSGYDDLLSVCFPSGDQVGYVVGYSGDGASIGKTTNSGGNWTTQLWVPNDEGLWSVNFLDNNIGYTVGGYGMILKTVDGGGIGISEENGRPAPVGQHSVALRCSPNPFSGRTIISLGEGLDRARTAKLGIVDASGREVRALLVEPGIRSICWDGTDDRDRRLPGGVYFVRLEAGQNRATCKVLVAD
jgi:photosystem II stability/assembly factor-like uncharacterized protein